MAQPFAVAGRASDGQGVDKSLPVVVGSSNAIASTNTFNIPKPANVRPGDLLLCFYVGTNVTPPDGWTSIATGSGDNGVVRCWGKIATGTEPANYAWQRSGFVFMPIYFVMVAVRGANEVIVLPGRFYDGTTSPITFGSSSMEPALTFHFFGRPTFNGSLSLVPAEFTYIDGYLSKTRLYTSVDEPDTANYSITTGSGSSAWASQSFRAIGR